jgi:hypothetical protein
MVVQGVSSVLGGLFAAWQTSQGNPFACFKIISIMGLLCSLSGFLINTTLEKQGDLIAEGHAGDSI